MKEMRDDVFLYLADLPNGINEIISPCIDGYTVYVDARLDLLHRQKAYDHAVRHIVNGDFQKADVQQIEYEAHQEDKK